MDFILIIGVFEAISLSVLILSKKEKSLSDFILSGMFFLFALNILLSFIELYNKKNGYPHSAFIHTSVPFIFLHGPALWFYVKVLTQQHFRFKPIYLLHFLPFLAVSAFLSGQVYFQPFERKIMIDASESFKNSFSYPLIIAGIALSTQGYFVWCLIIIRRFNKKIKAYFSQLENINLKWLKFLMILTIISYLLISGLYVIDFTFKLFPYGLLQSVGYVGASLYILILGFYGHRQGNLFTSYRINLDLEKIASISIKEKALGSDEEKFVHSLLAFMNSNKSYLNPELNIAKLSEDLNVSVEYLSGILNSRLNMNFYDFVNNYRIEEFKKQCKDIKNQNLTIIGIAYNCGFNSKATFNRVFKKATRYTPSEYLLMVSKK